VVIVVGLLLVDQVAGGVLRAKRSAAIVRRASACRFARSVLADVDTGDFGAVARPRARFPAR